MKSNELRIGNIVCYDPIYPSPVAVKGLHANGVDTGYRKLLSYDDIHPIPITNEILERAGWKNKGKGDDFHDQNLWVNDICEYQYCEGGFMVYNSGYYGHYCDIGDVQFLHQLQNLFYALEGKELIYEHFSNE